MDAKNLLLFFLLDEDVDEDLKRKEKRKIHSNMIRSREKEGAYSVLVERHLLDNEEKFREYTRFTLHLFHGILNIISDDLKKEPTSLCKVTISPAQKLCIPYPTDEVTLNNCASLSAPASGRLNENATEIRNQFKDYFNGASEVPWQMESINTQI